ncbi:alpha/beta hydrolase [Streptomyces sp. NPDC039016]|uniref:alpha/beta hydrolase n=1 Tax=Streptomyces sp. NPDC039016 TaxID=3154330 RepID=UPI0033FCE4B9
MSAADEEAALLGLAPVAPDRTVPYGPHPDQVVDLYGRWPGTGPLVVLLHGGFWRAAYDRRHLSPCAAELARHGLPVALVEYRRVGAGGGAPQTFEDVPAAVEAAAAAGAGPADPPREVVLVGHSAGGHLALLAATRPGTPVTRVVAVAPVADLARAHALGLSDGAVAELLGTGPGFAGRLAAAHPATALHELPGTGHYAALTPGTGAFRTLLGLLRDGGPAPGEPPGTHPAAPRST